MIKIQSNDTISMTNVEYTASSFLLAENNDSMSNQNSSTFSTSTSLYIQHLNEFKCRRLSKFIFFHLFLLTKITA